MTTLQQSYERLCFFRDTVFSFVEKNPKRVNMVMFWSGKLDPSPECKTYGCVAGWGYYLGGKELGMPNPMESTGIHKTLSDWLKISDPEGENTDSHLLFGIYATLNQRKTLLYKLIAEREQQLNIPVKPSGSSICELIMAVPKREAA